MLELNQGDILKIEKIKFPVLVASKDFFNSTNQIIGCPIYPNSTKSPLHAWISTDDVSGYVQCEKLALLDLNVRGHKKIGKISLNDKIEITDIIQGIFDYV